MKKQPTNVWVKNTETSEWELAHENLGKGAAAKEAKREIADLVSAGFVGSEFVLVLPAGEKPPADGLTIAQRMSRKLQEARQGYEQTQAYSGNLSADNADAVAQALRGLSPKQVVEAAERILGLEPGELWAKYERLNPGQQRMNAGNRIRGAIKRGDVDPEKALAHIH